MKVRKLLMLIASIGLVFGMMTGCGGGGSGDASTDPVDTVDSVTKTIDESGGIIELSSGFKVTFPQGAVEGSTQITVSETSMPAALPSGIQSKSPAYKISTNAGQLNLPAELKFPEDGDFSSGKVAVYRWDAVEHQWKYAGGRYSTDDATIKTQVDGFSVYIIGAGGLVYKPVEFRNNNSVNMIVRVSEYEFNNSEQTARLASQVSVIAWRTGSPGGISHDILTLPQGKYSFCADWWDDGTFGIQKGWYRKFIGDLPRFPAVWLAETSGELIPTLVSLGSVPNSANMEPGRCGPARIFVPAGEALEFDFVGTYNVLSLDPNRTYEEFHAIFIFESDHSFFFEEWGGTYHGTGVGTWEFDSTTNTFSFSVDGGASFSGIVSGTTNTFNLAGKWSGGTAGEIQLTRP